MKLILTWIYLKVRKIESFLFPFIIFSFLTILLPAILLTSYSFQSMISPEIKYFTSNIFESLGLSFLIALSALVITLVVAFPLALLIWNSFSPSAKRKILLLLAFPLVSNYFIKLIGLKSCFDFFNGRLNSTFGCMYTIIGLVYLSLPLVVYNFVNTLSLLPKEKNWAIRDLGQTFWGEFFFLLLPWSKTTFLSSAMMFFLPSLFTTFISEFLNHDPSSRMIGEVISSISSISISSSTSRPFIAFLVSVLFFIVVFSLVFGVGIYRVLAVSYRVLKKRIQLRVRNTLLKLRTKESFAILKTVI